MKRKVYMIRHDYFSNDKVWINGNLVPEKILNLKLISENEIPIPTTNLEDLLHVQNYHRELGTPENANAFEPIKKEGYGENSDYYRMGNCTYPCMGETPCFFVLARYYEINEEAYEKFVKKNFR